MTIDEATKIIDIMFTAHDDCIECGARLVSVFASRYPEFQALADGSLKDARERDDARFKAHIAELEKASRPDWAGGLLDYGLAPVRKEGQEPRREDYPEFDKHQSAKI